MTNENINTVNTAAADQPDPQTIEAMQVIYESYFDKTFTEDNSDELQKLRDLIVKPYCKKHGLRDNSAMARVYSMFVIGFNCGMEFVEDLDKYAGANA